MTLSIEVLFGDHGRSRALKEISRYENTMLGALKAAEFTAGRFRLRLGSNLPGLNIGKSGIAIPRPPSDEEHWVTLLIQPGDSSSTFNGRLYPPDNLLTAMQLYDCLIDKDQSVKISHSVIDSVINVNESSSKAATPKALPEKAAQNPVRYTQERFAEVFTNPRVTRELVLRCGENDDAPCAITFRESIESGMTEKDFAARMRCVFSATLFDLGEQDQIAKLAQTGLKRGSRQKPVGKFLDQVLQTSFCMSVARKLGLIEEVSGRIFLTDKVVAAVKKVDDEYIAEDLTIHELVLTLYLIEVLTHRKESAKHAAISEEIGSCDRQIHELSNEIARLTTRRVSLVDRRVLLESDLKPLSESMRAHEQSIEEKRESAFTASYSIHEGYY